MLTKVYLEGALGQEFGREWELDISTANDAMRIIGANFPHLTKWLREKASKYAHYRVVVEYESGRIEALSNETYQLTRQMKSLRFVPVIGGAGKFGQAIVGVVVIVVGAVYGYFTGDWATATKIMQYGAMMTVAGLISGLTTPSRRQMATDGGRDGKSLASTSFDSQQATIQQGSPIPIIYGRTLIGSQPISAGLVIEQAM